MGSVAGRNLGCCFLRLALYSRKAMINNTSAPTATPTPIPIFAPDDSPPDEEPPPASEPELPPPVTDGVELPPLLVAVEPPEVLDADGPELEESVADDSDGMALVDDGEADVDVGSDDSEVVAAGRSDCWKFNWINGANMMYVEAWLFGRLTSE